MSDRPSTEDTAALRYALELFLLGGEFELYEDDRPLGKIAPDQASAELSYGKVIFSCWGEGWSRSWRIIGCGERSDGLTLQCTRQMGLARSTLELRRGTGGDGEKLSRQDYCKKLAVWVESALPGIRVKRAVVARDDQRSISGSYARLVMIDGNRAAKPAIAGIGASSGEHQAVVDRLLGAGIVWAEQLGRMNERVDALYLFVPAGQALTIETRLTSIRQEKIKVFLYEVDQRSGINIAG